MSQPDLESVIERLENTVYQLKLLFGPTLVSDDLDTITDALSLLQGMRWRSVETQLPEGLKLYFAWVDDDEVNEGGFYYALSKEKAMPWATHYLPITPLPALPQETR